MAGFELRDRRPESAGHHGASRATQSDGTDRKSTRLNSSHGYISYAVFCLKKKISAGRVEIKVALLADIPARLLTRAKNATQSVVESTRLLKLLTFTLRG